MTEGSSEWFRREFEQKYAESAREIGRFNLAIFGKTGVGKSTLVNAIFGTEVAATGIGAPVTVGSHLYMHASGHFGVLDTQGVEIGRDDREILGDLEQFVAQMRHRPLAEQIHVAWYCVNAQDRRFERTEAEFIRALDRFALPVLLVLTQVPMRHGEYHPDALALRDAITALELPLRGEPVFLTLAKPDPFSGMTEHGLHDLLDATFRVAPQGVGQALTAAQQIDLERKRKEAQAAIRVAVASAGAAGLTPIPFSDAAILVPLQLTLMGRIANIYGIEMEKATVAALAATTAATTTGRSLATGLLKLVPGVGTLVGGAISGGVASSLTWAMGQAWLAVCTRIAQGSLARADGTLDRAAVQDLFLGQLREGLRRGSLEGKPKTGSGPPLGWSSS